MPQATVTNIEAMFSISGKIAACLECGDTELAVGDMLMNDAGEYWIIKTTNVHFENLKNPNILSGLWKFFEITHSESKIEKPEAGELKVVKAPNTNPLV